jgi:hypothetical protein
MLPDVYYQSLLMPALCACCINRVFYVVPVELLVAASCRGIMGLHLQHGCHPINRLDKTHTLAKLPTALAAH